MITGGAGWPPTFLALLRGGPPIVAATDGSSSPRPPTRPDASTAAFGFEPDSGNAQTYRKPPRQATPPPVSPQASAPMSSATTHSTAAVRHGGIPLHAHAAVRAAGAALPHATGVKDGDSIGDAAPAACAAVGGGSGEPLAPHRGPVIVTDLVGASRRIRRLHPMPCSAAWRRICGRWSDGPVRVRVRWRIRS